MKPVSAEDSRMKRVTGAIRKAAGRRDMLIEILHLVQDLYGYLPLEVMRFISREMKIPSSRIQGVATFYHFFSLKPKGEHNCLVCTGTACHVKGSRAILSQIEKHFGIKPGETTPDGFLGLESARCIGCCGLAPVVVIDEEVVARANPDDITDQIRQKIGSVKA